AAAEETGKPAPAAVSGIAAEIAITDEHRAAAKRLLGKERAIILLGHIAQRHPQFSDLRALAAALAALTGAGIGYIAEGANGAGASIAGVLPHRGANGADVGEAGLDVQGMISSPRRAYVLFGIEPGEDIANGERAQQALKSADSVITFSPYVTPELLECSSVILPIGTFAETAGTFVNAEGRWQSFEAAADLPGEARPGWRVLRVLANRLGIEDADYRSAAEVLEAARSAIGEVRPDNSYSGQIEAGMQLGHVSLEELDVPIYSVDAGVRRSEPLQRTVFARGAAIEREVTEVKLQSAG